jgi:hypothetical protein
MASTCYNALSLVGVDQRAFRYLVEDVAIRWHVLFGCL